MVFTDTVDDVPPLEFDAVPFAANQFQATKEFPLPLTLELLPTVNPSASKLSTVSALLLSLTEIRPVSLSWSAALPPLLCLYIHSTLED